MTAHLALGGLTLAVKSNASRRADRESEAQHCSPSGSPVNSDEFQLGRTSILDQNLQADDVSLVRVRRVRRQQRVRNPRLSHNHSNSMPNNDPFDAPDSRRSPSDSGRTRNNAELSASYDRPRISVEAQRAGADTAVSIADTLGTDEPTNSPETDKSWFSDCSSAEEENTTASNSQDTLSCRLDIHASVAVFDSERLATESEQLAAMKRLARVSASRKIQRAWRRWRATQPTVRAESAPNNELSLSLSETSRTQSRHRSGSHPDREFLTAGVDMQKVGELV